MTGNPFSGIPISSTTPVSHNFNSKSGLSTVPLYVSLPLLLLDHLSTYSENAFPSITTLESVPASTLACNKASVSDDSQCGMKKKVLSCAILRPCSFSCITWMLCACKTAVSRGVNIGSYALHEMVTPLGVEVDDEFKISSKSVASAS